MAIPNWNTNDVPTEADFDQWFTPRGAIKTANTTRSSTTTLTADPHVASIAVEANALFRIAISFEIQSPATADFKWDLTGPTGFAFRGLIYSGFSGASTNFDDIGLPVVLNTGGGTGGNNDRFFGFGWLSTSSTAGSITLRWAQNTSDAGSTILLLGTHINLIRMS